MQMEPITPASLGLNPAASDLGLGVIKLAINLKNNPLTLGTSDLFELGNDYARSKNLLGLLLVCEQLKVNRQKLEEQFNQGGTGKDATLESINWANKRIGSLMAAMNNRLMAMMKDTPEGQSHPIGYIDYKEKVLAFLSKNGGSNETVKWACRLLGAGADKVKLAAILSAISIDSLGAAKSEIGTVSTSANMADLFLLGQKYSIKGDPVGAVLACEKIKETWTKLVAIWLEDTKKTENEESANSARIRYEGLQKFIDTSLKGSLNMSYDQFKIELRYTLKQKSELNETIVWARTTLGEKI